MSYIYIILHYKSINSIDSLPFVSERLQLHGSILSLNYKSKELFLKNKVIYFITKNRFCVLKKIKLPFYVFLSLEKKSIFLTHLKL